MLYSNIPHKRVQHVYPIRDEREHDTNGTCCWCRPVIETADPETGVPYPNEGMIVIHNSADCRELIEQAEAIKRVVEENL